MNKATEIASTAIFVSSTQVMILFRPTSERAGKVCDPDKTPLVFRAAGKSTSQESSPITPKTSHSPPWAEDKEHWYLCEKHQL
jgi:hypothetical protein